MRKSYVSIVVALTAMSTVMSSSAVALPVYNGQSLKGAQIFVLSNAPVTEAGYHINGPTESYLRRRDAKHLRAAMAAEERLQRQEVLEAARREAKQQQALGSTGVKKVFERALGHDGMLEPPAHVVEAMQKPAPTRGGIRMGRYGETAPEAPKAEQAVKSVSLPGRAPRHVSAPAAAVALKPEKKVEAPVAVGGLRRIVVNPREIPVFKAGRVMLPKGWFGVGLKESPFTITELVRLARRRCLGMSLDGDVLNLTPMGNQPIWIVMEPAAVDRGEIWMPKSDTPVDYVEFEPDEGPSRVRITGGYLVLRPGVIQAIAASDKVGRGAKSDPIYAQAKAVMALRKAAADQRQWGRVLAGIGIALGNGQIVKAVTGNTDGFTVQAGLDFPKWEFFRAVSKSNY